MEEITIDDFAKLDIRIGEILEAEKIEESEKLFKIKVDLGKEERQIISGIAKYFNNPEDLIGRQVPVLTNLPTRKMMGYESQGMILYAVGEDDLTTVVASKKIENGSELR